ncbi:BspA family leucine-rich repeat surface protein [Ruminococcus albus]|uniref:BspA family leucine-rich repeat surface protein n=1 Tax=Ruminococcus albus TaxID=1264 RepID=UPI0009B85248
MQQRLQGKIKSVSAEAGTVFTEDSSYLFTGFTHCTSFDLSNTDTSNVTNMSKMFNKCFNITEPIYNLKTIYMVV